MFCLAIATSGTLVYSLGRRLSKWHNHSDNSPCCIIPACSDILIAARAPTASSVSFWDGTTHQLGSTIHRTRPVWSMTISSNRTIATGGDKKSTLRNLCDILPLSRNFVSLKFIRIHEILTSQLFRLQQMIREPKIQHLRAERADIEEAVQSLRVQDACQSVSSHRMSPFG